MSAWERRHNGRRIYAVRTTAGTWVAHLDNILNGERVPGVFPTRKAAFHAACLHSDSQRHA